MDESGHVTLLSILQRCNEFVSDDPPIHSIRSSRSDSHYQVVVEPYILRKSVSSRKDGRNSTLQPGQSIIFKVGEKTGIHNHSTTTGMHPTLTARNKALIELGVSCTNDKTKFAQMVALTNPYHLVRG